MDLCHLCPGCYTWRICLSGSAMGRRGQEDVSSMGGQRCRELGRRRGTTEVIRLHGKYLKRQMCLACEGATQLQRLGGSVVACLVLCLLTPISPSSISLLLHVFCPLSSCCFPLYSAFAFFAVSRETFMHCFCERLLFSLLLVCLFPLPSFASGLVDP